MRRLPTLNIITAGRSGTNYFVSTLKKFTGSAAYYELFNENGAYGITDYPAITERLSEIIGHKITDPEDAELVRLFRERPALHLNLLNHCASQEGFGWMSYKVFAGQTDVAKLKHSLTEENSKALFITRSRLDTYISLQKAFAKNEWMGVSTSDVRPQIDIEAFVKWTNWQNRWYEEMYSYVVAQSLPFDVVNYEEHINVSPMQLIETVRNMLTRFGIEDTSLSSGNEASVMKKQDTTSDSFDKIANGAALKTELLEQGLYDYAVAAPLSTQIEEIRQAS